MLEDRRPTCQWLLDVEHTDYGPGTITYTSSGRRCGMQSVAYIEGMARYVCRGHGEAYEQLPGSVLKGKVVWLPRAG